MCWVVPLSDNSIVLRPELLQTEIRVPFDTNGLAWEPGESIQLGALMVAKIRLILLRGYIYTFRLE